MGRVCVKIFEKNGCLGNKFSKNKGQTSIFIIFFEEKRWRQSGCALREIGCEPFAGGEAEVRGWFERACVDFMGYPAVCMYRRASRF